MSANILTANGGIFDFEHPRRSEFTIEDIAHALSHICRFTGHVREFYSVAQHSVHVSHLVPPEHALAGLLHDAPEAFIGDVTSPLKRLLPDYKAIEKRVEAEVLGRFGVALPLPDSVKEADLVMLATERRDLMPQDHPRMVWMLPAHIEPRTKTIDPWDPELARQLFLYRFYDLTRT